MYIKLITWLHHFTLHTPPHSLTTPHSLHYTIPHNTTSHHNTLHCITKHDITFQYSTFHYATLRYATLLCTTLHYTTLHYAAPHHAAPHHTTPHHLRSHPDSHSRSHSSSIAVVTYFSAQAEKRGGHPKPNAFWWNRCLSYWCAYPSRLELPAQHKIVPTRTPNHLLQSNNWRSADLERLRFVEMGRASHLRRNREFEFKIVRQEPRTVNPG